VVPHPLPGCSMNVLVAFAAAPFFLFALYEWPLPTIVVFLIFAGCMT
jgi:hypothetical protein